METELHNSKEQRTGTRVPFAFAAIPLVGLVAAIALVASGASSRFTLALIVGPLIVATIAWDLVKHWRSTKGSPTGDAPMEVPQASGELRFALSAVLLGVAIIVLGHLSGWFWAVTGFGFALVVGYWRRRFDNGVRAALCFVGVFVALYGIFAMYVQYRVR